MSIMEQTAVVIGEAKHGVWRIQENGHVREYRKSETIGLAAGGGGVDPNDESSLTSRQKEIVENNYASFLPAESWDGYKYPDEAVEAGQRNFIDLSIYHSKYGGKYEDHVPIDLPHFYCTMSGPEFPHIRDAWKFAVAQPRANQVGPLGKRAGKCPREGGGRDGELRFNNCDDYIYDDDQNSINNINKNL